LSRAERRGPIRTCLGCRRARDQRELLRIAASTSGALCVSRDALGRGAWLCVDSRSCIERGVTRRALVRALRVDVTDAAVNTLREGLFVALSADVRDYGAVHEAAHGPRHQMTKG